MKLSILTNGETTLSHLSEAYQLLDQNQKNQLYLTIIDLGNRKIDELEDVEATLVGADLVIFDAHGVRQDVVEWLSSLLSKGTAHIVPLGGNSAEIASLLRLGSLTFANLPRQEGHTHAATSLPLEGMDEGKADYEHYVRFTEYWRGGGTDNLLGLLCLAGREYGGCHLLPEPKEPVYVRELTIMEPSSRTVYSSAASYRQSNRYDEGRPNVAILYLGNSNPLDTAECIAQLKEQLEAFVNVMPIAFPSVMNIPLDRLRELLLGDGHQVDLIVNLLPFRLGIGPGGGNQDGAVQMLEQLDVPMLHPLLLNSRTEQEWRQSASGLEPSLLLVQVMLPELDGSVEMFPIAALQEEGEDAELNVPLKRLALIPERTKRLTDRIRRWLALRSKPNAEKKLALIGYNYPPGEGTVFGGSFLDTFESIARLLSWLKQQGYHTEELSAAELRARFIEGGLVNSAKWSDPQASSQLIRYADPHFTQKLSGRSWGEEAISRWGQPPGDIMTDNGSFLIPGLMIGQVFIGLQPSRGIHEDPEKSLHDRSLLPTHQYTAFYQWIREQFQADAIVHIGTHGTLEFQRGKEAALSGDCVPDDLLGDLPNLYYYYVGNPSEAMIAKRRSHAVLIGYQAPAFTEAELYGEWRELEALLHEYREAKQLAPERCEAILQELQAVAKSLDFSAETVEHMEEELYRMQRSLIPSGLHVLGDSYSPEVALNHMQFVLRHERGNIRSIRGLLAERQGVRADALTSGKHVSLLRQLDEEANALVTAYVSNKAIPDMYKSEHPDWLKQLEASLEYGYEAYLRSLQNEEAEGLMRALEGRYVPAKLAGDVLRTPEIMPTGRNLYQFDPRLVPSRTAAERGAIVAENSIQQYREQHGDYPHTTAVILWGIETSRTQGETIGQILHYMGVRIGGGVGTFRTEYEVIPLAELGRPRLNVMVHITGVFRDLFPNLLEDLHELFRKVSELDEPDELNWFKAHTRSMEEELLAAGYEASQAHDLACARIFGPAEGEYGTTVTRMIETKLWNEESELGAAYSDSQQHVYSALARGQAEPELYRSHMLAVDIVSQIRSSHEWEVTDSDHYYEYFGGLAKSVEVMKGRKADIHITDTTGEHIKTESAEHAIARGVRTRLTNPKWINDLLKHPYHGAKVMASRFEYVLGLAATTGKVEPWVFDRLHDVYVADEELGQKLQDNNRWAYHAMIETLLESEQRGYWTPDEQVLNQLRQKYLELEGELEGE
ncbi:magnesium chelatase subunit H [Paenibacillus sp. 7541]|uniref:magnesium chelatase subunit H n=1 Tax=Paenibacillus sp. 7541 TaxID=2026236 RepID=UPI000BA6FCFA|nr:magnesium chelatase subunit H [Paenibacillus sp. 7541]PAK55110.1 magnesium chelatase subunit H [Paenibacillus sp. 7541]